jgi:dUTP pyrophosphatase
MSSLAVSGDASPIGPLDVRVKVLPHGEGLELPAYSTGGAVGLDLRAAVEPTFAPIILYPGRMHKIPTGLCFAIPPGHAGLVLSRSGLAAKHQVAITNAPGLVDPDYRGEVFLLLENRGSEPFSYRRGDRLGQLLIVPAPPVALRVVADLDDTERGEGGFGSTGVSA